MSSSRRGDIGQDVSFSPRERSIHGLREAFADKENRFAGAAAIGNTKI
jgi:hypothetical protein